MDQRAPVQQGTREHCARLLVPPAALLVIMSTTATVVS